MKFTFHPEALNEFYQAVLYYSEKSIQLGTAFYQEVNDSIQKIVTAPLLYAIVDEDIRRCLTRRFPYSVFYSIEKDYILILAIANWNRKPFYWQHRKT